MDWCLIAFIDPMRIVVILEVALALGAVIFVHELGHFAAAKLCGVKVEKFYLGFDIFGWKLAFRHGETEYGIGALPLGGYVKMLGQDDNPANYSEEVKRSQAGASDEPGEPAAPVAERLDPRSYLAKSVPQRMLIISAGVIMNLIFAFIFAGIAYYQGVEYGPCVIDQLMPGEAAWRAGLQPGDRIAKLGNLENPTFNELRARVMLGDIRAGLATEVERPGVEGRLAFHLYPDPDKDGTRLRPTIGLPPAKSLRIAGGLDPQGDSTPATEAQPPLAVNDEVVAVDGQPVESYIQLEAALAAAPDRPLKLTIRRPRSSEGAASESDPSPPTTTLEVTLPPNPRTELGLVMSMAPITAVQEKSPAALAGVQPGETIVALNGEPVGDPTTLPERVRRLAGQSLELSLQAAGENPPPPRVVKVAARTAGWYELPAGEGLPLSIPELGVAYGVASTVTAVIPDSPAAAQGIKPGDQFLAARVTLGVPAGQTAKDPIEIPLSTEKPNWPFLLLLLQNSAPGTKVALDLPGGRIVTLEPTASSQWFVPERGLLFADLTRIHQTTTLAETWEYSRRQVVDSVLQVYLVISSIVRGQVSAKILGGPIRIAAAAGYSAYKGVSELLLFLTMLSANLAVVNFLPIPMLDGGHMAFLAWEGVRGKPASERVIIAFHYAGLCLILSLMGWVLFQDAVWFQGWLNG